MLTATLLILAVLLIGAGFGLMWRKLDELSGEVRQLRALLEERAAAPVAQQPAQAAAKTAALARPVVVRASPGRGREEEGEPALFPAGGKAPSDDPFNDSWVVRPAPPPRPPAQVQTPRVEPALPPPPRRPSLPAQPAMQQGLAQQLAIAAALLTAPLAGLLFGAAPAFVALAGLGMAAAMMAASLRRGWRPLSWAAVVGGGAWAMWAAAEAVGQALLTAVLLALAALVGLVQARLSLRAGAGGAFAAAMAAAALVLMSAQALPGLATLGAIAAMAAIAGASASRLEPIHVGAWLGACLWLLLFDGRAEAAIWFAPAAAWTGALFLGIAAVRGPALGARGTVVNATGALGPVVAVMILHMAAQGGGAPWALAEPWQPAAALCVTAAALAGILVLAARRARRLTGLGWAAFPLGFGAPAAAALAALIALPVPFAATALAAISAALALLDTRVSHPMWRFGAALSGAAAAIAFIGSMAAFAVGSGGGALATLIFGAAAPGALALAAARGFGPRAPVSAMFFEASALIMAAATVSGLARLAYAEAPSAPFDFAEAGLHAALWLCLSLMIWLRARRGAWLVREWGAAILAGAALCLLLGGPITALNPLWGASPEPATGWPVANLLAFGFALPALAAWAHYAMWRGQARGLIALGAGVLLTGLWALLEVRRAFHGPDLAGPLGMAEFGAMLAAAGVGTMLAALARAALLRQAIRSSSTS